ncbi:MAG: HAMP domain-containing protein [Elusimicrobia bacterium]|nr:HAMP domain-containing protein [Elusimicrobiota bacterium]
MGWLRSGLFRRVALVMGALALIPLSFLSWKILQSNRAAVQGAVLELHVKLAEKAAEQVEGWVDSVDQRVKIAIVGLRARMDWTDKKDLTRSLVEAGSGVASVTLLREDGGAIIEAFSPVLTGAVTALDPKIARAALRRAILRKGGAEILRGPGGPMLVLHRPIQGGVYARVVVPLRELAERIASERVGGTGFAVLVDGDGRPLSAAMTPRGLDLGTLPEWPITRAALGSGGSVGSSEFIDPQGVARVGAYAPVPVLGGAVLVLQSREEAYLASSEARRTAGLSILATLLVSLFAAFLLARALTAPLLALTRAAESVARGDFLARVDLNTGDELQELAETFNTMTARLRSYSVLQVDRLIAEQRKTEAILFSIAEGIVLADREGRVQLANRQAREMFGLAPDADIDGRPITEALPPGPLRDALVFVSREPGRGFKEADLSDAQTRRILRVVSSAVVTPGRNVEPGVVFALRDVTLERELEMMKDDFLHYITHDLRNPLGSAMGFLEVLLKGTAGVLNADQHAIVSSVRRSTSRLMSMINNILDIAKMESGRAKLQLKTLSLAGVAGRAIDILEQLAKAKQIAVNLAAAEEFSIEGDSDMLERVFTNLLGNAIKFTPEGGAITISITDDGKELRACVEDNGDGIPREHLQRVFDKFEQVPGQRRGGTGLGLTITRYFVEAHLGRIWVESETGRGARFYFTIRKGLTLLPDGSVKPAEAVA